MWAIYKDGELRGTLVYAEDAAALVAVLGDGTEIRYGHRKMVWTEGQEEQEAAESYDYVAQVCHDRAGV